MKLIRRIITDMVDVGHSGKLSVPEGVPRLIFLEHIDLLKEAKYIDKKGRLTWKGHDFFEEKRQ